MRRVHIMGGPGSGKTSLARRVAALIGTEVYEMDWVGWERDTGRERSVPEKLERVRAICGRAAWVTEGTMLGWTDPLLEAADLVVWLDVPWPVAVWRMLVRHVRAERAGGNPHPGWRRLFRFIWYTRHYYLDLQPGPEIPPNSDGRATRARTAARLAALGEKGVRCRTSSEVRALLERIRPADDMSAASSVGTTDASMGSNKSVRDESGKRVRHEGDRLRGHTERRLALGGFALLALGGGFILWTRYGGTAAMTALAVILAGAGVVALLWLLLSLMEVWARSD